ncbi:MAG: hypothetical protein HYR84_16795 [Planctomycetes bacterium]|nr:hypothetical protein [Planctomycetota bacterium]
MTESHAALEQRLIDGYQAQAQWYSRAHEILARHGSEDGAMYSWVVDLQSALNEVAAIDMAMTADKAAFRQSGEPAGPALRQTLDALTEIIGKVAQSVDAWVARLTERRNQLAPQLDEFIRQRQMLHAYGPHRKPIPSP